ncbi:MAG TPA: MBL fold metallo-hydrolase [Pedobacter sp.]
MKKMIICLCLSWIICPALAQEELRIHHINVEDGDATMIGIYNTVSGKYTNSILIDGGNANPNDLLLPYLKKVTGNAAPHFDYVVLTHYHQDHYNGLLALKDGRITADSVIDAAGYPLGPVFPAQAGVQAPEDKPASLKIAQPWMDALTTAVSHGFVKAHALNFMSFGTSAGTSIGHQLTIGTNGGLPVVLECVAGWGNTENGDGLTANPAPDKDNANDFSLGFVLTCGQFRYFIGGDMGGETKGDYIDQETPLTASLKSKFPVSWSYNHISSAAGHICGFKANHHGSGHSNDMDFMKATTAAVTVTSAGRMPQWHLPNTSYLKRLDSIKPLSVWTSASGTLVNRGVYMTNLYDFPDFPAKTLSVSTFPARTLTSFSYGNSTAGQKSGYMISVKPEELAEKSAFQVYKVDNAGSRQVLLANFLCHSK